MENNENQSVDFESILKAMQMAESLKDMFRTSEPEQDAQQQDTQQQSAYALATAFDEGLQTPELKALKAAIPYLTPQAQRQIGLFTKLMELKKLMEDVTTASYHAASTSFQSNSERQKKMLLSMRPYLQKEKQQLIDMLVKFTDMRDFMQVMQKMNGESQEES